MRVLHVHQIAHIPQLLVSGLRKRGIRANFVEKANEDIVCQHDIVHGHYALNRNTIEAFRIARRNKIPFILHCHGSDIRLLTGTKRVKLPFHYHIISQYIRRRSSRILLSTPDLIEFEPLGTYVPNPVDLDFFRPMPEVERTGHQLIMGNLIRGSRILEHVKPDVQYDCVNTGQRIDWPDNVRKLKYVPYEELPEFFNRYEFMLGTFGDLISMARLEAMACGLRTFTDFEKSFSKYYEGQNPDEADEPREFIKRFHAPEMAVDPLVKIYRGLESP